MTRNDENVQVVQDLYAARLRGDQPAMLALVAEEADWCVVGRAQDSPFAGFRQGREQIAALFELWATMIELLAFDLNEVLACDRHIVALGHERIRVRATGRVGEYDWAQVFTVGQGQIQRLVEYGDTAAMAAAWRREAGASVHLD